MTADQKLAWWWDKRGGCWELLQLFPEYRCARTVRKLAPGEQPPEDGIPRAVTDPPETAT